MFTLEINGTAIAITNAKEEEAKELFHSEEFKDDLKGMTRDGETLWNGAAPFTVRAAKEDEIDSFEEAMEDDDYEDEDEDEDEEEDDEDEDGEPIDLVFLVEVDDDEDDADDDEDEPANDDEARKN